MSDSRSVAIIGAGGQAKVITEIFELSDIKIKGYVSCEPNGSVINGYPVLCSIEEFPDLHQDLQIDEIIISIGDNYFRQQLSYSWRELKITYINAIHPKSIVSPRAKLGNGVLINAGVVVNPGSCIGNHCNIGTNSSIDHDCILGDFVNIAPGATLCGSVNIKECSVVGPGVIVREKTLIGSNSLVGAGSVVLHDIRDNSFVIGTPAKKIRTRAAGERYLR